MTATVERPAPEIGRDRRRKEDQRLITGRTRWTDNLQAPGMLHLAMVRSPFAHARITGIDTAPAKAAPNVVSVITGADVADEQGGVPTAWPITPDQKTPNRPSIAVDRVAFAGEVVAVVVARSAAEARDAAELVDIDYEELPAALDLKEAAADDDSCPSGPRHEQVRVLAVRLGRGGHGRVGRRGDREGPHRRDRDRAGVPPAAADPFVHGAPFIPLRPDRRADDAVVLDPDPAHHAVLPGRGAGHSREQGPGRGARCRRRLRWQAPDGAGGDHHGARGAARRQAVQVHREPLGVAGRRAPRP